LRSTKQIGDIAVAHILARLVASGFTVCLPFGDNARYDLVCERQGPLLRVQCKTGRLLAGAIVFPVSSSACHRSAGRRSYHGEVDAFAVHCPDTGDILLVPFDAVSNCRKEARLRVNPCRNGQRRGVRPAQPYLLHA
jgi:hypothetical protein